MHCTLPRKPSSMARTNTPPHFVAEIEAVNKALDDPAFTAVAFARSITKQIADMQFAHERIATIRSQLQEFERQVRTFGNDDAVALRQAALRLFSSAQALAQPILPLQPAHIVRQIFEPLQQVGWASDVDCGDCQLLPPPPFSLEPLVYKGTNAEQG
jgi:hypothetical protein